MSTMRHLTRAASLVLPVAVAAIAAAFVPSERAATAPWLDGSPAGSIAPTPRALTGSSVSNPYCSAVDLTANRCAINLRSFQFSDDGTASPYLTSVNVSIDGRLRLRVNTFFETTIFYFAKMAPHGLVVDCGLPNAGGLGDAYGKVHAVAVEPIDETGATMGGNFANVPCPAAMPPTTTTTSTTLSPCAPLSGVARARCELSAALAQPLCGAVAVPPAVDHRLRARLESAGRLLQKATTAQGRRLTRLLTRARRALDGAGTLATRATNAKKPARRLPPECAAAIGDLVATVEQFLPPP